MVIVLQQDKFILKSKDKNKVIAIKVNDDTIEVKKIWEKEQMFKYKKDYLNSIAINKELLLMILEDPKIKSIKVLYLKNNINISFVVSKLFWLNHSVVFNNPEDPFDVQYILKFEIIENLLNESQKQYLKGGIMTETEMAKLIDEAKAYEPKTMKNIADLEIVNTDIEVTEESFGEGDEKFTAKVSIINGERYRIPLSVLKSLKVILEDNPNLKKFRVKKTGTGMNTEYTVIPLM